PSRRRRTCRCGASGVARSIAREPLRRGLAGDGGAGHLRLSRLGFVPSAGPEDIEPREVAPGYSSRYADWGGITVAFEKAHAGEDASALVRGLPDDRCQAPHWGFLFSG